MSGAAQAEMTEEVPPAGPVKSAKPHRAQPSEATPDPRKPARPKGPGHAEGPSSPRAARESRTERLAAALKANLRRRKAQARDRAAEREPPGQDAGPAKDSTIL